jgi:Flp pilus assembly protein CpaB
MRKNVIPLVVIALVVAVASTGIFYGLIVSRMDGSARKTMLPRLVSVKALEKGHLVEPSDLKLTTVEDTGVAGPMRPEDAAGRTVKEDVAAGVVLTEDLLTPLSERGAATGVPDGMRAVTVHISDSSSVVKMLHPGDRVDVQALIVRQRNGENDVEARTLLQNATVFQVPMEAPTPQMQGRMVLTLLSTPQDAERLSAADAGAKLRVVLRNPGDQKMLPLGVVSLMNLGGAPRPIVSSQFVAAVPAVRAVAAPMELEVSLIELSAEQMKLLSPEQSGRVLSVASSNSKQSLSARIEEWKRGQKVSVLASSRLVAGRAGELSWKASEQSSLRVRIEPLASSPDGNANLRIQPESTLPVSGVATTRRVDSNVSLNREQGAIVSGLFPSEQVAQLRERLTPGGRAGGGELLMLITPVAKQ